MVELGGSELPFFAARVLADLGRSTPGGFDLLEEVLGVVPATFFFG
jgi:hypothetical protein